MANVFVSVKDINYDLTKWVDTRFSLNYATEGQRKFDENHVAGGVYWNLEHDLSDMSKTAGRHPLPEKEALTRLFRKSGFSINDQIAVYDDGGSPFAARAWWLLQYAGFKKSFIVLEGFEAIKEAGIPVDNIGPRPQPSFVTPEWDEAIYAPRNFVEETVAGKKESVLLDARSAERYRGETEPLDPIAGRIPGALNFDWEQLKESGIFKLDEAVKMQLNKVVNPLDEVTVYCGSGVTAAPLYAMLKEQGYEFVRLYIGSYSDWISRAGTEVERG